MANSRLEHSALRIWSSSPNLHQSIWRIQRCKSETRIKAVRVASRQEEPAQPLQVGMRLHHFQHALRDAAPAMLFVHDDVSQVGECRPVCNNAEKSDLHSTLVRTETDGVRYRTGNYFCRNPWPVGARHEGLDYVQLQSPGIGADHVVTHVLSVLSGLIEFEAPSPLVVRTISLPACCAGQPNQTSKLRAAPRLRCPLKIADFLRSRPL